MCHFEDLIEKSFKIAMGLFEVSFLFYFESKLASRFSNFLHLWHMGEVRLQAFFP